MDAARYRIVFRGEIGLGYEQKEIRENLIRLTRWDEKKVDQLLASSNCIIKSDLDAAAAERMLKALNNTGIICQRERLPEASPTSNDPDATASIAVVGRPTIGLVEVAARPCPKCGHPQDGGLSCPACGVVFAKLEKPARIEAVSKPVAAPQDIASYTAAIQRSVKRRRNDPLSKLEQSHPLAYYLGKLVLAIFAALLLHSLYRADMGSLILLLLPVAFLIYLGALSGVTERPFGEIFVDHFSLLPIISSDRDRRNTAFPFATYVLILLNAIFYFVIQLSTPVEILQKKWFFLPLDASVANLCISAVASLFMHASGFAFLSGLLFLWIIGATLERRIGSALVVVFYLLCGLTATGVAFGVQNLFFSAQPPQQVIGAGGALAGLFGAFAIRSHLRSMLFPLPFLGIDTLLVGAPYQVRWSSLLVAGLLVLAGLHAPVTANSAGSDALGLAIFFGGLFSGLLAASFFGLGNEAGDEEDEDVSGSTVFTVNEKALRRRLEGDPDNPELLVQLARVLSRENLTDEARELYRRVIVNRLSSKPKEAAEIYREFTLRFHEAFEPKLTIRLSALYLRLGEMGMSASVLLPVCDDPRATPQEREKALYQYILIIAKLEQLDEAFMMLKRFTSDFPDSPLLQKLRDQIHEATQM